MKLVLGRVLHITISTDFYEKLEHNCGLLSEDFKIGEILARAHLTYPADWSSFQAMEAEQGPGIQAGFPQV